MERLLETGCRAGRSPVELEDWTCGEILMAAEAEEWRQRRNRQAMAVIAHGAAELTAYHFSGGAELPVYEVFPFWEQEERDALRLAHYRRMMEGLAGTKGKGV